MKIKNIYLALILLPAVLCAKKKVEKKEVHSIEHYLDFAHETPSQFSTHALRGFFNNTYSNLRMRHQDDASTQSKTSLFNESLSRYIAEEYNTIDYADKLSRDGSHFIEFLSIGNELSFNAESMYTCLRLLANKVKWCEIVDYTVVDQVVTPMATLLERYFIPTKKTRVQRALTQEIERIMLNQFTSHLDHFQQQPDTFISKLAAELGKVAQQKTEHTELEMVIRLRFLVKQMLETMISKMMWDPNAYECIIPSFLSIGNGIVELAERGIFNHMDDLDDLITTLNIRLCFFFDMFGSVLPVELYNQLMEDLNHEVIFFLELPEQDEGVTPKKEILIQHALAAKTKAYALEVKGMHSDQVV